MNINHLPQIDFLKALAVISVIFMHSINYENIPSGVYLFSIVQAVPIFLILTGFNWCLSFKNRNYNSLSNIYSKNYFESKFKKFIVPYIIIFIFSFLFGIVEYLYFGHTDMQLNIYTLIGLLPMQGPGNYYFTIMLELTFIFPLLYILYLKNSKYFLAICFILNLVFELISPFIFTNCIYLYNASVLRFLFLISLGMWLSKNNGLLSKNFFILIGLFSSIIYLFLNSFKDVTIPYFLSTQHTQNIFSFFYPLLLVSIGIKYLPKIVFNNSLTHFITTIGKYSYHIFLVQILYFSVLYSSFGQGLYKYFTFGFNLTTNSILFSSINIIFNESACILLGLGFHNIMSRLITKYLKFKRGEKFQITS